MVSFRSLLFVPAIDTARISKIHTKGADGVILDLEDAVPASQKEQARADLSETISNLRDSDVKVLVRINQAWRDAYRDLEAAMVPGLCALVVPKVECPMRLTALAGIVHELEIVRGIEPGSVGLIALIESPLGLSVLTQIAETERVVGLALGSEDFSLELGIPATRQSLDLPVRQIVLAAAAKKLMALAVPCSIAAYGDEAASRAAASLARDLGATGALCVHPSQVTIANETFGRTPDEIENARDVLRAWSEAGGELTGVAALKGRMIDRPVVEHARRVLGSRPQG